MTGEGRSGLRYLSADDVVAAMPPLDERLVLAERTMVALVADAQLPPKIAVHPRPTGSFGHAMPAHLRGADASGSEDLVGMKWIAGFPENRAAGLPALHGLVLLVDARTGIPQAILDAGPITAERTAAVSGVAIQRFAPTQAFAGRAPRVALIGAGVQGRSHLPVIGRTLPDASLTIFDRHEDRAKALAETARETAGIAEATIAPQAREAVAHADVVVTAASFGPIRQVMTTDWIAPDALVVAVDYATYVAADVARNSALFLVDQREQFLANRDAGAFDDYPDPTATIGEAIVNGTERPASGRVLATHLGVGLADLIFGNAILERAIDRDLGVLLTA